MKKTIAVMLLMGSVAAVNAQDTLNSDLNNDPQRLEMTGYYHAKGTTNVPAHFQSKFQLAYPNATDVAWYEVNDWYRAAHNLEGRMMNVYYTPNGSSFVVALPVVQSWVPEDVISMALNKYGNSLYAVNTVKVAGGTDAYQVSIIENGVLRNEWIAADGTAITDVFRTGSDMARQTMIDTGSYAAEAENTKVKTKIEKADGTEIKTKTKKGKTKVKTDD